MPVSRLRIAAVFGLSIAVLAGQAVAQQRGADYVFKDDEGHLVLRYAGTDSSGLTASQFDEVSNVELSTMVHDRLRADALFEAEPVDANWARPMKARLASYIRKTGSAFTEVHVECRSASCRLVLEQRLPTWSVEEHRALMGVAQRAIQGFIEANPGSFEPVFLIAGHYQEPERPYMSLFLRRTAAASESGKARQ